MTIKLGSTDINKIYLGSTEIKKAYLGSTLIYDKTGGGALPTYTFRVTTTAPATTFTLRTAGTVNYDVDWGDASSETGITTNAKTHEYATANTYTIVVTPAVASIWKFYVSNQAPDDLLITDLVGADPGFPWSGSVSESFYGLENVTSFPEMNFPPLTDCLYAFSRLSVTSFPLLPINICGRFWVAWANCFDLVNFPAGFFDSWSATPSDSCFKSTWLNCTSLSATSVENILNSIDTSGVSAPATGKEITIDYNRASGQPNINTAIVNLTAKGWEVRINGTIYTTWYNPTDADARTWINAVEAADGQGLETAARQAYDTFVQGLKIDNNFTPLGLFVMSSGARTFAGSLVPLVGPTQAPVNISSGDYTRAGGILGDFATKYIDTAYNTSSTTLNNVHWSVYETSPTTPSAVSMYHGMRIVGVTGLQVGRNGNTSAARARCQTVDNDQVANTTPAAGLSGVNRINSTGYTYRIAGQNYSVTRGSSSIGNLNLYVNTSNVDGAADFYSNARVAAYACGTSLNQDALESRIQTFLSAIAAI